MAKEYLESGRTIISRSSGMVHQLFRSISRIFMLLGFALLTTIVIEITGAVLFWPDQGAEKSRQMMAQEVIYLGRFAEKNPFLSGADEQVFRGLAELDRWLLQSGLGWLAITIQSISVYIEITVNMVNVFVLRVFVMLFSFPVYVFFGVIGLTRGLVKRELRKWGGGRESSGQFHLWMNLVPLGFMSSWFLYLSWPFTINPNYIVMPFAMFFGWMIMLTSYRIKKHL